MITAVIALWAAYNPTAAWAKFWLLAAAIFLFYSLANQPPTQLWFIAKLLSFIPLLIASYFLLTHDWQANPTYISLLDRLAERWLAIRPSLPSFPPIGGDESGGATLHPNQAAGLIITFVPFSLAVGWRGWRTWPIVGQGITILATLLVLFALLLTASRGAWLALAAAMIIWAWSPLSQRLAHLTHYSQARIFRIGLALALIFILTFIYLFPALPLSLANRLPGAATAGSRAAIFSNTLYLLADFPFTGAGLDAFPGLYSQYILVIPQRIFTYAHNLFLDVALEQGISGLAALIAMLFGSLWLLSQSPDQHQAIDHPALLRWAVAVGLIAMIGCSLVDDAFYANRGTPLLWLLPGLVVAISRATTNRTGTSLLAWQWPTLALILLSSIAISLVRPQWRAAWLANLGAVQMARVELAGWPTNKWADGRYLPALHSAEQLFIQALEIHPANRTAHYRLGLIAMLRRDFATAIAHLEAAYPPSSPPNGEDERGGPYPTRHPGVFKALAYAYLWAGQLARAQSLLAEMPEAKHELTVYTSWWRTQERDDLARRSQQMLDQMGTRQNE
jgi:O-antigen ligase